MADPQDPWAAFNPQPLPSAAPAVVTPTGQSVTLGTPKTQVHLLSPDETSQTPGLNPNHTYQKHPDGSITDLGDNGQGLDPGSVDFVAHQYLTSGQMPALGMGNSSIRKQILDRASEIAGAKGLTGEAFATQIAHYKAGTAQVQNLEKQLAGYQQSEDTALANGEQFIERSAELPGQTQYPLINSVVQGVQRNVPVAGHDTVAAMDNAWKTFSDEYAKVLSGSPSGSGVLSDSAREAQYEILKGNYSLSQKRAALSQVRADMANRIAAMHQTINDAYTNLSKAPGYGVPDSFNAIVGGSQNNGGTKDAVAPVAAVPTSGNGNPPAGGGGNSPTDPSVQNVGGFRDQLTYSPDGAVAFHDALFNAAHAGQIKSVGDAQTWAAQYNKQHGTDYGVADSPVTRQAISAAVAGKPFSVDIPQMSQTEAARMNDRINVTKNNPKADAAIAGGLDSASVGAFRPLGALADATGDALTGKPFDYTGNLNADTNYIDAVKQGAPASYLGGQLAGALVLPTGGARTVPELSRLGAAYGGTYGFNSSAGQPLADKGVNALTGAIEGAALPIVFNVAGRAVGAVRGGINALASRLPEKAADFPINPDALAQAGQREGVTVNRAMINPNLDPKTTAVGKTMIGSRKLQSGMRDIGNQIEDRTQALGQGGTALEPQTAGGTVAGAGLRYITQTGQQFNRLYGSLQKATAGVKIPAAQAQLQTEELIKQLSEMPNQNAKEIEYLQGLRQDLSKPLTIDAMRGLRTKIRQDLAGGNLTFGPNEARVQSIADAAASDISNGLNAAGKGDVASRFQQVDAAYRDRMDMIQNTVQKLIGKRGQNLSGEQVYANLKTMAGPRGNASGLTRMFEQMTPDERNDMAATFADALGKNQAGDFSTAFLAKRIAAMPQAMRTAVFGQDGAKSLSNLALLATAHARVANKLGGSPTGLAGDYRGWLTDLVLGGGAGILTHSEAKGAAIAATGAALKATRDLMNARMLLNPDIQKWLSSAPSTVNQKAIDVHFNRLNSIAARNPGIAQDIMHFKQAIMNAAANNNAPVSGAVAASPDQGPQQQAQPQ